MRVINRRREIMRDVILRSRINQGSTVVHVLEYYDLDGNVAATESAKINRAFYRVDEQKKYSDDFKVLKTKAMERLRDKIKALNAAEV